MSTVQMLEREIDRLEADKVELEATITKLKNNLISADRINHELQSELQGLKHTINVLRGSQEQPHPDLPAPIPLHAGRHSSNGDGTPGPGAA